MINIVVIGAGSVGYNVAKTLEKENVDVMVIDIDAEKIRNISDNLDVGVVQGDGTSLSVLRKAEIEKADIVVVATNDDRVNMIATLMVDRLFHVRNKIVRLRDPQYYENSVLMGSSGINATYVINPEKVTAREITNLVRIPIATNVMEFEQGKVKIIGLKIKDKNPYVFKLLKEVDIHFLVVGLYRENELIIPSGDCKFIPGDIALFIAREEDIIPLSREMHEEYFPIKSVVIMGGGHIGKLVAKQLEKSGYNITVIERNKKNCESLSKELKKSSIVQGDASDIELLKEENVFSSDCVMALTNDQEFNILVSLLSKRMGVKRTITLINMSEYFSLAIKLGLDAIVAPKLSTSSAILRFVRHEQTVSVVSIFESAVEAIENVVRSGSYVANKLIKDIKFPRGCLVGGIIRKDEVIIPKGEDMIMPEDKLIVFTLHENLKKLKEFFDA
ncbi:MAG: Trk system potassium transporter TrkA [Campylobacterota bacterium]|nr:Trk system potassium transporter TrkA [Campylobacterota bacterium]